MTTPQPTPYTEAMRSVRLSEEEKAQLKAALSQRDGSFDPPAKNPGAPAAARTPELAASRRSRAPKRLVAGLLAATLALGGVGIAVAAGSGASSIHEVIAHLFGGAPASEEITSQLGAPVGISQTSDGVTVTLDSVIGDGEQIMCVFSIEPAQEEPNEEFAELLETLATGAFYFDNGDFWTPVINEDSGWRYKTEQFFDLDPADTTIQYFTAFAPMNGMDASQTVTLSFTHLGFYDLASAVEAAQAEGRDDLTTEEIEAAMESGLIASGLWEFELELDSVTCQVEPLEWKPDLSFEYEELLLTVAHVKVTPMAVTIELDVLAKPYLDSTTPLLTSSLSLELRGEGGEPYVISDLNSSRTIHPVGDNTLSDEVRYYSARYEAKLDRIIDPAHVTAIYLGDILIPVP